MSEEMYTSRAYADRNPTWHVEDSAWKAQQILRMLRRNQVVPQTICDVGCGAGEVLRQLQQSMDRSCEFHGYEIAPYAFGLCQQRAREKLHFKLQDFLQETDVHFDLLLLIDVIEHVEDYFTFLRKVKPRARYKVLHIPLDLSAQAVVRPGKLPQIRQAAGHIHYFTRETALRSLEDAGYEVMDHFLTAVALESSHQALKTHLANLPRRLLSMIHQDLASRLLGGFSLMVLAT